MFRRVISTACKLTTGVGAVQLGAAGVALTDKQLSKKPEWYQNAVRDLETTVKTLSKYGFIESDEVLNNAEQSLQRFEDFNNPEIAWRLARAYTEKAQLTHDHKKKIELLHKAVNYGHKALSNEGSKGIAGAHKWYALAVANLMEVDSKFKKDKNNQQKLWVHFKRATELDATDPFSWLFLGQVQLKNKNYKEAADSFKKGETIKPGFSATNAFYLGEAEKLVSGGSKDVAIKHYKTALAIPSRNKLDGKCKGKAKAALLKLKVPSEEFVVNDDI